MEENYQNDSKDIGKFKRIALLISIVASCLILIDSSLLERAKEESVTSVNEEYQSYYNAAGNGHSTYKVTTENHEFHINPEIGKQLKIDMNILVYSTLIFNQPQHVKMPNGANDRVLMSGFTGITLPLFIIVFMLLGLRFKGKVGIITFVLQVALLLDLLYLMT